MMKGDAKNKTKWREIKHRIKSNYKLNRGVTEVGCRSKVRVGCNSSLRKSWKLLNQLNNLGMFLALWQPSPLTCPET